MKNNLRGKWVDLFSSSHYYQAEKTIRSASWLPLHWSACGHHSGGSLWYAQQDSRASLPHCRACEARIARV